METRPLLGAIAVVLHEGRALLVQRAKEPDSDLWGFPGGHVEWGETAMEAAARELREETGVVAEPVTYLTNVDVLRRDAMGRTDVHYLLAAVLCRYVSGTPLAADDARAAAWVPVEDVAARALPMSERVAEVLEAALRA